MTDLFKKLNWKGHQPVALIDAPASLAPEVEAMADVADFHRSLLAGKIYSFGLVFALTRADMEARARDSLWKLVEPLGLQPNRQVAIDDDWSALRFKRSD